MVDAYEKKHGIVEDRTQFDGEIVVPPHLRHMTHMLGSRPMRLHGGLLGSLSRSRTFLTLPTNSRDNLHSSVPDLSRNSLPNTPNSNVHRMILANSVESVIEEASDQHNKNSSSRLKRIGPLNLLFSHSPDKVELRRKSEQDIKTIRSTKSAAPIVYTTTPSHYRNNSDSMKHIIPFRVQTTKKPNSIFDGMVNRSSQQKTQIMKQDALASSSLHNISTLGTSNTSKWGPIRNSNSFSSDFNVNSLATRYTIPRPLLGNEQGVVLKHTNGGSGGANVDDSAA